MAPKKMKSHENGPASSPSQDILGKPTRRVILYVGGDPKFDGSMFYLNLFWCLMTLGQQHRVEMVPVVDTRPDSMRVLQPPEVARLVAEGGVDGMIGFMVYPAMTEWMKETGLPWTVLSSGQMDNNVDLDYAGMFSDALGRLAKLGCKSAGLMIPTPLSSAAYLEQIDSLAEKLKLTINYEWILVARESQELSGYNDLRALWDLKHRPEGLVVFPDRSARGVVSAICEKRIRVPEELRLILHRNAESPYVVPMPCDWVEVSVNVIAEALLANLDAHWAGRAMERRRVPFRLIEGAS
jgi:DNA-binding LacI/PurR family transcriptional regulator